MQAVAFVPSPGQRGGTDLLDTTHEKSMMAQKLWLVCLPLPSCRPSRRRQSYPHCSWHEKSHHVRPWVVVIIAFLSKTVRSCLRRVTSVLRDTLRRAAGNPCCRSPFRERPLRRNGCKRQTVLAELTHHARSTRALLSLIPFTSRTKFRPETIAETRLSACVKDLPGKPRLFSALHQVHGMQDDGPQWWKTSSKK